MSDPCATPFAKPVVLRGLADCRAMLHLIRTELPPALADLTDDALFDHFTASYEPGSDVAKALYDADHTPIGFYRYAPWPRDAVQSATVHLFDIAVDPQLRRRGVGSALIGDLIADCRRGRYRWIVSRTDRRNTVAIEFHKRYGFAIEFTTEDAIVWRKAVVTDRSDR